MTSKPGDCNFEWNNWSLGNFSAGEARVIVDLDQGDEESFRWDSAHPDYTTRGDIRLEDTSEGCELRSFGFGFMNNAAVLHPTLKWAASWG